MNNKVNPVIYYFSLFYFLYVVITDFRYILTSPTLLFLAIIGVIAFVYGFKNIKKVKRG